LGLDASQVAKTPQCAVFGWIRKRRKMQNAEAARIPIGSGFKFG
jgi:hypothetical protein